MAADHGLTERWEEQVERVIIHVPHYLSFTGEATAGGRQRFVRDMAKVVRDTWKRDVVFIQKATQSFDSVCPAGFRVIGVKCRTDKWGDPVLGRFTREFAEKRDGVVYASGEDPWPFLCKGAKAIQHGIWWDGPYGWHKRVFQRFRVMRFMEKMKSVLCVDTNFINWLRCQGPAGLRLVNKCFYAPNYADTDTLRMTTRARKRGEPLRLIYARRHVPRRGPHLFLDTLRLLAEDEFPFHAKICTVEGVDLLKEEARRRGIDACCEVLECTLDEMMKQYADVDVAVVPTLWSEGTSLACVEAICAGVPVVASPVGGLGNIVIPNFNGLVAAPQAEAFASAIIEMGEPEAWAKMHENCLSMREALSLNRWKEAMLHWLAG